MYDAFRMVSEFAAGTVRGVGTFDWRAGALHCCVAALDGCT